MIWLQPFKIIDDKLLSVEKKVYMNEEKISAYRQALLSSNTISSLLLSKGTIINPVSACVGKEDTSMDGVHYSDEVYKVVVQMISNAYSMRFPSYYNAAKSSGKIIKDQTPKPTGSMSFPIYGLWTIILATIMLFSMDNFLGVGYLSLHMFGRSFDWEGAYGPLLLKILGKDSRGNSSGTGHNNNHGNNSGDTTRSEIDEEKEGFLEKYSNESQIEPK